MRLCSCFYGQISRPGLLSVCAEQCPLYIYSQQCSFVFRFPLRHHAPVLLFHSATDNQRWVYVISTGYLNMDPIATDRYSVRLSETSDIELYDDVMRIQTNSALVTYPNLVWSYAVGFGKRADLWRVGYERGWAIYSVCSLQCPCKVVRYQFSVSGI